MKKFGLCVVGLIAALGLSGCGEGDGGVKPSLTQDEAYQICIDKGGDFSTDNDAWSKGYKCVLPKVTP